MSKSYLYGGVGNQLFQYFYPKTQGDDYKVSFLFLESYSLHDSAIGKILDLPENQIELESKVKLLRFVKAIFIRVICKLNLNSLFNISSDGDSLYCNNNKSYFGYWQDCSYYLPYRHSIKNDNWIDSGFFKSDSTRADILSSDVFVVHVRKKDYLSKENKKIFADLDPEFYRVGFGLLNKNIDKIIICTDDVGWVKRELLSILLAFTADVSFSNDYGCKSWEDDFNLMRYSRNLIISNSTFAWWAAFLNESDNVYYPSRWYVNKPCFLKLDNWEFFGD